jgi:hypothetical protein
VSFRAQRSVLSDDVTGGGPTFSYPRAVALDAVVELGSGERAIVLK